MTEVVSLLDDNIKTRSMIALKGENREKEEDFKNRYNSEFNSTLSDRSTIVNGINEITCTLLVTVFERKVRNRLA